jgi:polysaccharide deacetylase family protein (PEP-CTERM system associated)
MTSGSGVINAMTVDVEDYFQVSAFEPVVSRTHWEDFPSRVVPNTERLLRLLAEHEVKATFFILGWVAERHPSLVSLIADLGHEIASHGYWHQLVYEQTPRAFRDDIRRSKDVLEQIAGQRVEGYRAPSFSITSESLWALDILIEEGFRYDASIFPIRHDRYGIPDSPRHPYVLPRATGALVEVPGSTARLGPANLPVAGGGYFRLLPYGWTRWGITRLNERERRPAVFYLHPWEVDPDQPRLQASALSRFRHYRNLDQTEPRLRRLLAEFRFAPLRHVLADAELDVPAAELLPQAG